MAIDLLKDRGTPLEAPVSTYGGSSTQDSLDTTRGEHESAVAEEIRINLGDPQQVQQWAVKLGISPERLRALVAHAGPRLRDLQQRLSQPSADD